MADPPAYETKELSDATWPDFETLFSRRGQGWDHCSCMAFQRVPHPSRTRFRTRAEVGAHNRQLKRELVAQGRAHGVLVYANGQPIGWCQYGPADELLARGRATPPPPPPTEPGQPVWRITCFVVDKRHRRAGVASHALRAALAAIRARGGGLVEAYPAAAWTHGRGASAGVVHVEGVGPVAPAWGSFGNISTSGTVSMFEQAGFEAVTVCTTGAARARTLGAPGCHVLMRRSV